MNTIDKSIAQDSDEGIKHTDSNKDLNIKNNINIESIELEDDGSLKINGNFDYHTLEIDKSAEITFGVKLKGEYKELNNCIANIEHKSINTSNGIINEITIFSLEFNILDLDFISSESENSLIIVLHTDKKDIKQEVNIVHKRTDIEKVIYKGKKRFYCKLFSDKTPLTLKIKERTKEIEVKAIYVYPDEVKLILDKSNNFNQIEKNHNVSFSIKKRKSDITKNIEHKINYEEGIVHLDLSNLISQSKLDCGIYDLQVNKDNKIYKLSILNDGIYTKKECIKLPRFNGIDGNGESVYFQPYFTDKNLLAFNLKKSLEINKIDSIRRKIKGLQIKGILYNRSGEIDKSNIITGTLYLEVNNDQKIEVNYTGNITVKNKNTGRCEFKILIPRREILNKNISLKEISSKLNKSLRKYSIKHNSNKSTCEFNIETN